MNMDTRMEKYLERDNGKTFHPYKPHVVSLQSKQLFKFLHQIMPIHDKQNHIEKYYDDISSIIKKAYNQFDPTLIYAINDELHFVFYFNDSGDFRYNGNIMKMSSSITSFVSIEFGKLFTEKQIPIDFYFTTRVVEFDKDFEVLNYIIWRQFIGKNNNFQNLYKCIHPELRATNGITLVDIDNELMKLNMSVTSLVSFYGIVMKRTVDSGFYISSFNLASDFENVFTTFFEKKILYGN